MVAWIGAVLFAGSLGAFAYFHAVVLGRPVEAANGASPVAWNIALFFVFALHHSLLARSGAKAWLIRFIPPELERSTYVWMASLLLLAVCVLWRPVPGVLWDVHGPARVLLYTVQMAGIWLTLASARLIDVRDLAGLRQVERDTADRSDPDNPFTTNGPYGWLRHPIYLGWLFIVLAPPTMTAGRALFAAVSSLYLVAAIGLEERSLVQEHGNAYRQYQRLVRWKLIPGVW